MTHVRLALGAPIGIALAAVGACLPSYEVVSATSSGGASTSSSSSSSLGGTGGCAPFACDPHNCGAAGHGCLGGACVDGVCQPVVFATGQLGGMGIAVGPERVYWTDGARASVASCPIAGCGGEGQPDLVDIDAGGPNPYAIAVGEGFFFWSHEGNDGALRRCDLPDCASGVTTMKDAPGGIGPVAVRSSHVYFGLLGDGSAAMERCHVEQCGASPAWSFLYAAGTAPASIAVGTSDVFWADLVDGRLLRCALDGCGGLPAEVAVTAASLVAVDDGAVYWIDESAKSGAALLTCPLSGCGPGDPKQLASTSYGAAALLRDGEYVYWVEPGHAGKSDGVVMRVGVDGTSPTVIADHQPYPVAIAAGKDAIYWLDRGEPGEPPIFGDVRRWAR